VTNIHPQTTNPKPPGVESSEMIGDSSQGNQIASCQVSTAIRVGVTQSHCPTTPICHSGEAWPFRHSAWQMSLMGSGG